MTVKVLGAKVSLNDLAHIERKDRSGLSTDATQPAIVSFEVNGFEYHFIWRPKPGSKRLYVFFAGDADRAKREPPVFHRWTWADRFDGHCLFVADPTLFLEATMGLGWYVGNSSTDCMEVISEVVDELAEKLEIAPLDVIAYGSSGGGFAAMRLGERRPGMTVAAINPQTDITIYHNWSAVKFLRVAFNEPSREAARARFTDRLVLGAPDSPLHQCRLIYAQNDVDTHHHIQHMLPFCERMGLEVDHPTEQFIPIMFSDAGGHSRAETPEVFDAILAITEAKTDL